MTYIVGANNSGKSTFIESLQALARVRSHSEISFPQPQRHHSTDAVEIQIRRSDGRSLTVSSVRQGGSQAVGTWLPADATHDNFDIHVTPSRRSFNPYFGGSGISDRDWGTMNQEFSRIGLRDDFVGRLRKVDREGDARQTFNKLLSRILGYELNWTMDEISSGQQFVKLIEDGGGWHTSEGLGDGLVSLLFIVDALYDSRPGSLIAIDEPELSLHPQLIRRLGRVLADYARDRQIVVATHSPLLIDWLDITHGATVARVYKKYGKTGACEISQASAGTLAKVSKLSDDVNVTNPHTVGSAAREALFLDDGVILTEGQDDVAYLPRVLDDLGLPRQENVYGWGSGGAGNIPKLAQLFVELGFTRIAAILDDDNRPGTVAAVEKLKAMAPTVLVRQIPAPDIRYKKSEEARGEVRGLLGDDNVHVRPELRAAARKVLANVIEHVATVED